MYKWRDIDTKKFLQLYRKHEFLWDNTNPLYKDRLAREVAYIDITTHMNIPALTVRDVKSKIKTIRTNYKFELNKVLRSEQNETESARLYVPHLFWFKTADKFLRNVTVARAVNQVNAANIVDETSCRGETSSNSLLDSTDVEIKFEEPEQIEQQKPHCESNSTPDDIFSNGSISPSAELSAEPPRILSPRSTTPIMTPQRVRSPPRTQVLQSTKEIPSAFLNLSARQLNSLGLGGKRKRDSCFVSLNRSINSLQTSIEDLRNGPQDDEFDLFGKSIALQLKRMPLERALTCQENIQRVMTQERIRQGI